MAKIYNEIVIDMNPESPTFEETLFEDSFEYEGDMMLMQGDHRDTVVYLWLPPDTPGGQDGYYQGYDAQGNKTVTSEDRSGYGNVIMIGTSPTVKSWAEVEKYLSPEHREKSAGERGDVGLPSITEEDWMGKTLEQQAQYILDTKYGGDVPNQENDLYYLMGLLKKQPVKGEIDPTKAGFISEQYGGGDVSFADSLAGRAAGQTLGMGLDTLQGTAGKVSGAMQNVYGGSGIGMRAGIAGQEALATGLETAYEGYGLARDTAGLDYRKGIYGLEEDVTGAWETDWKSFWSSLPEAT